jgi:hypothetical protein
MTYSDSGVSSFVGTRSTPIQNRGGIGRRLRSSCADVDGSVNGRGTCPPKSIVEQEDTAKAHPVAITNKVGFITPSFI